MLTEHQEYRGMLSRFAVVSLQDLLPSYRQGDASETMNGWQMQLVKATGAVYAALQELSSEDMIEQVVSRVKHASGLAATVNDASGGVAGANAIFLSHSWCQFARTCCIELSNSFEATLMRNSLSQLFSSQFRRSTIAVEVY